MGFFEKNYVEDINTWIVIEIWQILLNCHFSINIQRMSSFLNGPKTIVEIKTISLYMCRGNRILILNCKKTTTKGSSTSIFKSDCIVLVSTILSNCLGFHQNSIHCSMATKATVESRIISLYMCRGNHIHILNCKKTTTKGGSTSIYNSDCIIVRQ